MLYHLFDNAIAKNQFAFWDSRFDILTIFLHRELLFCPTVLTSKPFVSGDLEITPIIICQNLHNYLWFVYAEYFSQERLDGQAGIDY